MIDHNLVIQYVTNNIGWCITHIIHNTNTSTESDSALLHQKFLVSCSKNTISRNYEITNNEVPSDAKHYGCKNARHCDLIGNGRSQANREFACVPRNVHCCFARCTAITDYTSKNAPIVVKHGLWILWIVYNYSPKWRWIAVDIYRAASARLVSTAIHRH